jgi:riboflavin kinase / FMN adenylyltransferase
MKVARSLADVSRNNRSVITIGTFDGVHLAHQKIIREVVSRAHENNGRSVVVTFDPHPKEVLKKRVKLLTTLDEKLEIFDKLDVQFAFVIPFTIEFSRKPFREFYEEYIINGIGAREVIEGYDHGFGKDREAGVEDLLALGKEFGFSVIAEQPMMMKEEVISSSRIRGFLEKGNIEAANAMLGRPYSFSGTVIRGDHRGKSLGFPTINIRLDNENKILPANGVYTVQLRIGNTLHFGLMNVGVLPTFYESHARSCEVFILDFDQEIYDERVTVESIAWLREERKFATVSELVAAMEEDVASGRRMLEKILHQ